MPAVKDDPTHYREFVEGSWVIRHGGYYYIFYSGNNCCGPNAHYAVLVARSRSATGPFETLAPNPVDPRERAAPGSRPGTIRSSPTRAGDEWIVYHAVDTRRPRAQPSDDVNTRRIMLIDKIVWRDGWPHVDGTHRLRAHSRAGGALIDRARRR